MLRMGRVCQSTQEMVSLESVVESGEWRLREIRKKFTPPPHNSPLISITTMTTSTVTATATARQLIFAAIIAASCLHIAECGAASRRRAQQEEDDKYRYRQPFALIFFSIFLAVSLPLARFIHCICTDPLMPQLFKALKKRAGRMLKKRFGNIGDEKQVDDSDNDEYVEFDMANID